MLEKSIAPSLFLKLEQVVWLMTVHCIELVQRRFGLKFNKSGD